jgi:hypothetical protein
VDLLPLLQGHRTVTPRKQQLQVSAAVLGRPSRAIDKALPLFSAVPINSNFLCGFWYTSLAGILVFIALAGHFPCS